METYWNITAYDSDGQWVGWTVSSLGVGTLSVGLISLSFTKYLLIKLPEESGQMWKFKQILRIDSGLVWYFCQTLARETG